MQSADGGNLRVRSLEENRHPSSVNYPQLSQGASCDRPFGLVSQAIPDGKGNGLWEQLYADPSSLGVPSPLAWMGKYICVPPLIPSLSEGDFPAVKLNAAGVI
jgi:hypothetical protein